ncbi:methyltransferase domain-containing protein [Kitasatospora purpeofusca]|uniref:Protein-L-isoaspartate O-methyltransferase n=1 Tax=Kitasatospora purpeofusca TaxID=67352 RepID=A0ABZ1TW66_9ACTN|nr:methyltransferase domain-containing protein [Kitasatospora purpeofusca]
MTTEIDARVRLAREVERGASVLSSRVVEAFLNVPRHPFVPAFYRRDGGKYVPTRGPGPAWLRAVYADEVLVTEVDGVRAEDAPEGGVTGDATSSSTAPGLMAEMLDALDVRPGDRVWEIGTGTGYNAALLCRLAGAGGVTTVDRTARLVDAARERLREVGFGPAVLRADGAGTPPAGGPFDRIIATCAVRRVPRAWLEQCVTGGVIVAPIGNALGGGAVVRLAKLPGGGAAGRFLHRPAAFMPLRADTAAEPGKITAQVTGRRRASVVGARVLDDHAFSFWAGLCLPRTLLRDGGTLHDPADGSTAHVDDHPGHPGRPSAVTTSGPRDLWQLVESAWTGWRRHHRPRREWLTLTVRADGAQTVGFTAPDGGTTSWLL